MIMLPQRARVAESRVKHRSSNGPLRVQSNVKGFGKSSRRDNSAERTSIDGFLRCISQSILQREGIRQLPGICWYPAKRTASLAVNQGGTADFV